MNYNLINKSTKEVSICTKIESNGFDYYVVDGKIPTEAPYISREENPRRYVLYTKYILGPGLGYDPKRIVATNDPTINLPKVIVDEADETKLYF